MNDEAYWILRYRKHILTTGKTTLQTLFPFGLAARFGAVETLLPVGEWQGRNCMTAELETLPLIPHELVPLRALHALGGNEAYVLAGRAVQLLDWLATHRFCGKCGRPTMRGKDLFAMECPTCSLHFYPRISPAIMVLISRGDQILLARGFHFEPGMYSVLSGFVEPGETLEQCVHREVHEEVGIKIQNLRYFRSQPWPFPNSLMVAYTADYAGGSLRLDPNEIEAADWYSIFQMPQLPDPMTLSRQLIDAVLAQKREGRQGEANADALE